MSNHMCLCPRHQFGASITRFTSSGSGACAWAVIISFKLYGSSAPAPVSSRMVLSVSAPCLCLRLVLLRSEPLRSGLRRPGPLRHGFGRGISVTTILITNSPTIYMVFVNAGKMNFNCVGGDSDDKLSWLDSEPKEDDV